MIGASGFASIRAAAGPPNPVCGAPPLEASAVIDAMGGPYPADPAASAMACPAVGAIACPAVGAVACPAVGAVACPAVGAMALLGGGHHGLLGQWGQALGDRHDRFGGQEGVARQVVPTGVYGDCQDKAQQQPSPGGQIALGHGSGEHQFSRTAKFRRLDPEAPHDFRGIQAQRGSVTTNKRQGIGVAGQQRDAALLERLQVRLADAQIERDVSQRQPKAFAGGPEVGAGPDRERRGHRRRGGGHCAATPKQA